MHTKKSNQRRVNEMHPKKRTLILGVQLVLMALIRGAHSVQTILLNLYNKDYRERYAREQQHHRMIGNQPRNTGRSPTSSASTPHRSRYSATGHSLQTRSADWTHPQLARQGKERGSPHQIFRTSDGSRGSEEVNAYSAS